MNRRLLIPVAALMAIVTIPLAVSAAFGFADVAESNVHGGDIAWLKDAGVTVGCNPPANDRFCPTDSVTRQQMASFLRRLAENEVVAADTARTAADSERLNGLTADEIVAQAGGVEWIVVHSDGTIRSHSPGMVGATVFKPGSEGLFCITYPEGSTLQTEAAVGSPTRVFGGNTGSYMMTVNAWYGYPDCPIGTHVAVTTFYNESTATPLPFTLMIPNAPAMIPTP